MSGRRYSLSAMRRPRRLGLLAALAAAGLLLSGCGNDPDPDNWAEAAAGDFAVKTNYLKACQEANEGEGGFNAAAARQFCECSFDRLYAGGEERGLTFEQFQALDNALRDDPDPRRLEDEDRDIWRSYRDLVEACEADLGSVGT